MSDRIEDPIPEWTDWSDLMIWLIDLSSFATPFPRASKENEVVPPISFFFSLHEKYRQILQSGGFCSPQTRGRWRTVAFTLWNTGGDRVSPLLYKPPDACGIAHSGTGIQTLYARTGSRKPSTSSIYSLTRTDQFRDWPICFYSQSSANLALFLNLLLSNNLLMILGILEHNVAQMAVKNVSLINKTTTNYLSGKLPFKLLFAGCYFI